MGSKEGARLGAGTKEEVRKGVGWGRGNLKKEIEKKVG